MLVVIHLLFHTVCKYNKNSPKGQIFQVKILFFIAVNPRIIRSEIRISTNYERLIACIKQINTKYSLMV